MSFQSQIIVFVLACLCFQTTHAAGQERRGLQSTLGNAKASHASAFEYLTKKLHSERKVLKQLQQLNERGHATWFEWSQQQKAVSELTLYMHCLRKFEKRIREVEERRRSLQAEIDAADTDGLPLRIYSPDSIRLLGWVVVPTPPSDRLQSLEAGLLGRDPSRALVAHRPGTFEHAIKLNATPDLWHFTTELLRQELQMDGPLKECRLELAYLENSLQQLEPLCDARWLPESIRKKLVSKIERVNENIRYENRRRQSLLKISDELAGHLAEKETAGSRTSETLKRWSNGVIANDYFLDHLFALYQQQLILQAQQEVAILNLKFWQMALLRLSENNVDADLDLDVTPSGLAAISDGLGKGSYLERQKYQHKIELLRLKISSLKQQQTLFDWEERRFLKICDHLNGAQKHRYVSVFNDGAVSSSPRDLLGFLESTWSDERWDTLEICLGKTDFLTHFQHQLLEMPGNRNRVMPVVGGDLKKSTSHITSSCTARPQDRDRTSAGATADDLRNAGTNSRVSQGNRDSTSSDYQFYQYGELRAKYRSRARVGQIPWYLPGSPSNFGGPK